MPWTESTPMSQRLLFVERALRRTCSFRALCAQFAISEKTGYTWLARFTAEGRAGLADRSHARRTLAHQVAPELVAAVLTCRRRHPTWGPRKLRAVLAERGPETPWPAPSTIGALLAAAGLAHRRRRSGISRLASGAPTPPPERPNALWCADFKGQFRLGTGAYCYPLTITDHASRCLLACTGVASTQTAPARPIFRRAFEQYGLPVALRTDNGAPFATTALARLSGLSVWWIRLGIRPEQIQPGCPEQNGRHERMHKTLKAETTRPPAATPSAQQRRFDRWRTEYNTVRPHEALAQTPPARHYVASPRPYPHRLPPVDYPARATVRVVSSNGCFRWHGAFVYLTKALAGHPIALEECDDDLWTLSFGPLMLAHFDTTTLHLMEHTAWRTSPIIPV